MNKNFNVIDISEFKCFDYDNEYENLINIFNKILETFFEKIEKIDLQLFDFRQFELIIQQIYDKGIIKNVDLRKYIDVFSINLFNERSEIVLSTLKIINTMLKFENSFEHLFVVILDDIKKMICCYNVSIDISTQALLLYINLIRYKINNDSIVESDIYPINHIYDYYEGKLDIVAELLSYYTSVLSRLQSNITNEFLDETRVLLLFTSDKLLSIDSNIVLYNLLLASQNILDRIDGSNIIYGNISEHIELIIIKSLYVNDTSITCFGLETCFKLLDKMDSKSLCRCQILSHFNTICKMASLPGNIDLNIMALQVLSRALTSVYYDFDEKSLSLSVDTIMDIINGFSSLIYKLKKPTLQFLRLFINCCPFRMLDVLIYNKFIDFLFSILKDDFELVIISLHIINDIYKKLKEHEKLYILDQYVTEEYVEHVNLLQDSECFEIEKQAKILYSRLTPPIPKFMKNKKKSRPKFLELDQ